LSKSHYEILGIKEAADRRSIRAAYLKKIKASHPDSGRRGKAAEARAAAVNFAYFVLRDRRRRLAYDLDLKRERNGSAPPGQSVGTWEPRAIPVRGVPPGPPPKSRRAIASGLLLGAAILGLVLLIVDLESAAPPPRHAIASAKYDALPDPSDASPWVDRAMVDRAVDTLVLLRATGRSAEPYSRNCYSLLAESPNTLLLDHCLAFDVAAATWRHDATAEVDFAPAAMRPRQASALRRSAVAATSGERLREVNVATLAALARRIRPPAELHEAQAQAQTESGAAADSSRPAR
jgi:hypothetical protein